jgi:hypothetical protein
VEPDAVDVARAVAFEGGVRVRVRVCGCVGVWVCGCGCVEAFVEQKQLTLPSFT